MVDRLLLGSSDLRRAGSSPAICNKGIASSMVEHYTSDIGILVRFQCDAYSDPKIFYVLRSNFKSLIDY